MERPALAGRFSFVDTGDKIPDRHQDFGREFLIGRNPGKADGGMSPLGRMSEADEIAKAALYLASDDATNVTGIEITVDGGMTSAPSGAKIFRAA